MSNIDLLKRHLKFNDGEEHEDEYLQHLFDAAVIAFNLHTNRSLVLEGTLPDPAGNSILINAGIKQGLILLCGHWYLNRESVVVSGSVAELPLSTESLWSPYRWVNI